MDFFFKNIKIVGWHFFVRLAIGILLRKPPKQEWRENSWIRPGFWVAIDKRGSRDKTGTLEMQEWRKIGGEIKCLLREDRVERARRAGEAITLVRVEGKEKEL